MLLVNIEIFVNIFHSQVNVCVHGNEASISLVLIERLFISINSSIVCCTNVNVQMRLY